VSWLLDTCVISEATKRRPIPKVLAWLDQQEETQLYLSVLTLGELEKGIRKLPAGGQRARLARWLSRDVVERFSGRILFVDAEVALTWGRMQAEAERQGRPLSTVDSLIAATGIARDFVVVTRNTKDMRATGAEILDPWE